MENLERRLKVFGRFYPIRKRLRRQKHYYRANYKRMLRYDGPYMGLKREYRSPDI